MSATEPEFRGYDELDKEEQAFIDEYVQNYKNTFPVNIERKMGLETDRGRQIVEEYDDILNARREAYTAGDLTDDDLYTVEDFREDVGDEEAAESSSAEEYGIDVVVEDETGDTIDDADVTVDGDDDWEFSLYEDGETVTVEATADGYKSSAHETTVDENTTVTLTLEQEDETTDEDTDAETESSGGIDIPDAEDIDRDKLSEYEYYELQQIAPEFGVQGNIKEEKMVSQILEAAGAEDVTVEAEDEPQPDEGDEEPQRGPQTSNEKSYTDLSPLQQRVIDHWVQDPEQNKGDIEDKADASPGYSARLYRKYRRIRDQRREAYTQGILTDEHLNTPDFEEYIEDTSLDRDDWERVPEDEQPTGTPLEEVDGGEEFLEEFEWTAEDEEDTAEDTAEDEEPEPEAEDETAEPSEEEEPDEPEQLELPDASGAAASEDVDEVRQEVGALREAVEDIQANMETIQEAVSELGMDDAELEERLETIEYHSDGPATGSAASLESQVQSAEGEQEVRLDTAEWVTVVRALAAHDASEDVLFRIINQVN